MTQDQSENTATLISALRAELQEQWEANHSEHCTNMGDCEPGDCHWPRPTHLLADD